MNGNIHNSEVLKCNPKLLSQILDERHKLISISEITELCFTLYADTENLKIFTNCGILEPTVLTNL